jgi:hypothetical protein
MLHSSAPRRGQERRWRRPIFSLPIAVDLSHVSRTLALTQQRGRVTLSTHMDRSEEIGNRLEPRADEGIVVSRDADHELRTVLVKL